MLVEPDVAAGGGLALQSPGIEVEDAAQARLFHLQGVVHQAPGRGRRGAVQAADPQGFGPDPGDNRQPFEPQVERGWAAIRLSDRARP